MRKIIVFGALVSLAATANAAATPAEKCQSGKTQEAGKYVACLAKADAKLLTTAGTCSVMTATECYADSGCGVGETCDKDLTKFNATVDKCEEKFAAKWNSLEEKAGGACPDGLLPEEVKEALDECAGNVAAGLGGDGLSSCSGDLVTCEGDLTTCSTDLGTSQSDLASCEGDLTTCQGDLGSCNGDLGTCTTDLGTAQADLTTCEGDLTTAQTDLTTCEGDLTACEAAPQGQRVKTGQTQCWNAGGTVIPCAGTGQDGELQKGLTVSFTDNGNGTISDSRTGLMWERLNDGGGINDKDATFNWTNAFNKVKVLNGNATGCIGAGNPSSCCTGAGTGSCTAFAGHTDWRLPNLFELESLRNMGTFSPATHTAFNSSCTASCTTCSCTQSFYWSATTRQDFPSMAWIVSFIVGDVRVDNKTTNLLVRAVRTGS